MKGKITIIMLGVVVLCMGGVAQARPPTPPSELQHDELATQHDMIKTDTSDTLTAIAEVKALVEALVLEPLCGAGTGGQRFVAGTDEVCDNTTGLYWVETPVTTRRNQTNAGTHCSTLSLGNGQTYRLPEVKELISVIDYSQSNPALPVGHPFSTVQSDLFYWSVSSVDNNAGVGWVVAFGNGAVSAAGDAASEYVWCARSGS